MATFLIFRDKQKDGNNFRNASGVHAALVTAADEAAARAAAHAGRPTGETTIHDEWTATQLTADDLPAGIGPVVYFEGDALTPGTRHRGS